MLFLELKLNIKQGIAKERIDLLLFIKYITKNVVKGRYWTCRWEKINPQNEKESGVRSKIVTFFLASFGITIAVVRIKKVSNDFKIYWNTLMKLLYLKGYK